ncbi:MAG: acetyl-CoA carboxylase biotin carboxyl carrier protein [Candidatus Neomarinimicrobiota bacterium]
MLKDKIKNLIKIIEGTEIEEIEVSSFWGAQKIRLSKGAKVVSAPVSESINIQPNISNDTVPLTRPDDTTSDQAISNNNIEEINSEIVEEKKQDINLLEVKAPLVGTYYSSSKPSAPPFVQIGHSIKKGDTVCIIEAMKIFNEIESDVSGVVKEICVENGNPVEFDQTIIKVSSD